MRAEVALTLGRDDDLPDCQPARLLGERKNQATVPCARLEPDARVANLRGADQLVERNLVRAASGSSSSRLGFRCPPSRRESVLFEIPVCAATLVSVMPRRVRRRLSRGPTWARTSGISAACSTRQR